MSEDNKEFYAVYNPHSKPIDELPVIYGFNNGGRSNWWTGQLIAEDGAALGSHLCSNESYMLTDLGIIEGYRTDRHVGFREHYPDGYRMDFVSHEDVACHEGINKAYELNQKMTED